MCNRVKEGLPRTNNGFAKGLTSHPQIHILAAKYQKEQQKLCVNREHHLSGRKLPQVRKKYERINAKLKDIIRKFDTGLIMNLTYL